LSLIQRSWKPYNRRKWSRHNALYLHSGGSHFQSWPEQGSSDWGFSWSSLQTNSRIVFWAGHDLFLSNPFQTVTHLSSHLLVLFRLNTDKVPLYNPLTNYLMEMCSREAASISATQELRNIYGIRGFITVFTRHFHLALFRARSIQFILPHPITLSSILILSTDLRLDLYSGLFPRGFSTNILYAYPFLLIRATYITDLIPLVLVILLILCEQYKLWNS
jgi:hypothetical protein